MVSDNVSNARWSAKQSGQAKQEREDAACLSSLEFWRCLHFLDGFVVSGGTVDIPKKCCDQDYCREATYINSAEMRRSHTE